MTAVLDCRRLHMAYVELQVTAPQPPEETGDADIVPAGEPPPRFSGRSVQALVETLELELQCADSLCVIDLQWLSPPDLKEPIEALVERFRSGGGIVEYAAESGAKQSR